MPSYFAAWAPFVMDDRGGWERENESERTHGHWAASPLCHFHNFIHRKPTNREDAEHSDGCTGG